MSRLPKQNADHSGFARYTREQWTELDGFYGFFMNRWKRTTDFLRSIHWKVLETRDPKQIKTWESFPIVNLTLSIYNDYVTQWLQSKVRFSAVPDSGDPGDISAAELADKVLFYLWDVTELDSKKVDLGSWLFATGNGDIRVFWNKNTGDMVPLAIRGPDGEPIPVNPQTMQPDPNMKEPVMVDAGEIGLEIVPPQLCRYPLTMPGSSLIGGLYSYDDIALRYGDQVADKLSYSKAHGGLSAIDISAVPGLAIRADETALVVEHYLTRSSRYPNGLWWTSSDKMLITPPESLPSRRPPIVHFRWIPMPGHPTMGLTPLYDITFSNKLVDRMLKRTEEWLAKVVPQRYRQSGDGLKYGDLDDQEPFKEIVVNPGLEPKIPAIPSPPPEFADMRREGMEDALTVGGYRLGRRQKELPPGSSTQRVRQPPSTVNEGEVVALAVINSKSAWQQLGYILLDYAQTFYDEPRTISIIGQDRTYQWREFKGADLQNLRAKLRIDELPLYTWNRQALRDTVIGVMASPVANFIFAGPDGQPDRDRINAALEATGIDVSMDTLDPDVLAARNENGEFTNWNGQNELPEMNDWDEHATHIQEHTRQLKGMSFKGWRPDAKQAFLQHISQHEQAVQQAEQDAQEAMLQQEQRMRGIRADAETSQDVRTALGEGLVEVLMKVLSGETKEKETKKKSSK